MLKSVNFHIIQRRMTSVILLCMIYKLPGLFLITVKRLTSIVNGPAEKPPNWLFDIRIIAHQQETCPVENSLSSIHNYCMSVEIVQFLTALQHHGLH